VLKKKIWANFKRIFEVFTKKIAKKLLKIWFWDPRSGIQPQGLKKAPDPGSWIRIRNTANGRIRIRTNNDGSGSGRSRNIRIRIYNTASNSACFVYSFHAFLRNGHKK
jgi:hypothetical protein